MAMAWDVEKLRESINLLALKELRRNSSFMPEIQCLDTETVSIPRARFDSGVLHASPTTSQYQVTFYSFADHSPQDIGDPTCTHNAKSPYLRCAINPCGPCNGCIDYAP